MKMKSRYVFLFSILLFFGFSYLREVSSQLRHQAVEFFRQGQYERFVQSTKWNLPFLDEEILSLRVIALLKLGKGKEAQREITRLFQSSSSLILDHVSYYYLDYLAKQDNVNNMFSWLTMMERRFPNSSLLPRAYLLIGKTLLKRGFVQSAIPITIKSLTLTLFPEGKQEVFLLLSQLLLESQHFSEAFWILQKVHRDAPKQSSEIRFLVQSIIPRMDFRNWSPETKITSLEFLLALGLYKETEPLMFQVEKETLSSFLEKRFFVLQARVALHSNNLAQLESAIQKMTQKNEEEVFFYQGILEQRKGKYAQAIQKYEKVVTNFPRGEYILQAYRNMALCYQSIGKEREYVDTLRRVIALFPRETISFWELFRFFYLRNQTEEMKNILKQFAETNREEQNRALFWLYKLEDSTEKWKYLEKILQSGTVDYYYVRAWQELEKVKPQSLKTPFRKDEPPFRETEAFFSPEHWQKYRFLQDMHLFEDAEIELLFLHKIHPSSYLYLELSYFYERKGDYRRSILYAIYLRNQLKKEYPEPFEKIERKIYPPAFLNSVEQLLLSSKTDPYLFLALVRAESSFQVDAISSAGAVGLAQLLPSTALWVMEKGWVEFDEKNILSENDPQALTYFLIQPEVNLRIGIAYWNYLLDRFQGNPYLAICAYNAGPGRVNQWKTELPPDWDAFVEFIPFQETQNYLRRVITNYFFYSLLYRGRFSLSNPT